MARRATRKRAAPRSRRRASPGPIDAALGLAAERPWREVTLAEIAARAGMDEAALHAAYRSKFAILDAFVRQVDDAVAAGTAEDAGDEPVRDRLLDALLRRFDLLSPHKAAIASIARDTMLFPPAALCAGLRLTRSMARMLEISGAESRGPIGLIHAKALGAIYLSALWIWLHDDDPELGRLMAHLHRCLSEADRLASICDRFGRLRPRAA